MGGRPEKESIVGDKHWHVLSDIIKANSYESMVEIGVRKGRNASQILRHCPGLKKYYAVEPWKQVGAYPHISNDMHSEDKGVFERHCRPVMDRITVMQMMSEEAAPLIEDGSIDIIFIDGDHRYEAVKLDIKLWLPKVRSGGILSGHDIDNLPRFPGVKVAVEEAFDEYETGDDWTWWLKV